MINNNNNDNNNICRQQIERRTLYFCSILYYMQSNIEYFRLHKRIKIRID